MDLPAVVLTWYWKAPGHDCGGPGYILCRVTRIYNGQTGGEILPIRGYHDTGEDWYGSFLGLVLFRLVVPPLQPVVVGSILVRCAWFSSRLPAGGNQSY
jgi:hypothetical protein